MTTRDRIHRYLHEHYDIHKRFPTIGEITQHFEFSSRYYPFKVVKKLTKEGIVKKDSKGFIVKAEKYTSESK